MWSPQSLAEFKIFFAYFYIALFSTHKRRLDVIEARQSS